MGISHRKEAFTYHVDPDRRDIELRVPFTCLPEDIAVNLVTFRYRKQGDRITHYDHSETPTIAEIEGVTISGITHYTILVKPANFHTTTGTVMACAFISADDKEHVFRFAVNLCGNSTRTLPGVKSPLDPGFVRSL